MRVFAGIFAVTCLAVASIFEARGEWIADQDYVKPKSAAVRQKLEQFRDWKIGLMFHFGVYSQAGITESWPLSDDDAHWSRSDIARKGDSDAFKKWYFDLSRGFDPSLFDPAEWADVAARNGFKYVVLTTKHHDGFCLYNSRYSDYGAAASNCPFSVSGRADIVRALFDACRVRGLGIGAYYSKCDWHHDDYWENSGVGRRTCRATTYDTSKKMGKWNRFRQFTRNQILELVSGYGPIDILWMDGGWVRPSRGMDLNMAEIIEAARKITPGLIAVDRAAVTEYENVLTPEQFVPDRAVRVPWESCFTLSDGWGYHYDDGYKSVREIVHLLVDVVAKGGNLLLNVGPMPNGRLPRPAVERLDALGMWLKKNGEAVYKTRLQEPCRSGRWAFTHSSEGRVFAIRLWKESESMMMRDELPVVTGRGCPRKVVHVATGREVRMTVQEAIWNRMQRFVLCFDDDFVRDESADAFELIY